MAAEATVVVDMIKSGVNQYFWILITVVIGLLIWEIISAIRFVGKENSAKKIEEKMVKEGESESAAEKEVKEESKTRKKDRRVFSSAVVEFTFLKELKKEIDDVQPQKDVDFYGEKEGKKLKALKKVEKLEKQMQRRITALEKEGKRLSGKEPSLKVRIEELLLEMDKNHKKLLSLMAKGGQFEAMANTKISAALPPERKKVLLQSILQEAIKCDENIIAAAQKLAGLVK